MSALAQALATPEAPGHDPVRERILEAALEQFQLVGLRRSTVGDVARRAGVGRVTVYRRVGDKRELVVGAIQSEVDRLIGAVTEAIDALDSDEDKLVEAFVVGLGLVRSHPLLQRLLQTEPEDLLPYLTLEFEPILALARAFVVHVASPSVRDPELLGELLARLAQSLVLTPSGRVPVDDGARMRELARAYLAPLI